MLPHFLNLFIGRGNALNMYVAGDARMKTRFLSPPSHHADHDCNNTKTSKGERECADSHSEPVPSVDCHNENAEHRERSSSQQSLQLFAIHGMSLTI